MEPIYFYPIVDYLRHVAETRDDNVNAGWTFRDSLSPIPFRIDYWVVWNNRRDYTPLVPWITHISPKPNSILSVFKRLKWRRLRKKLSKPKDFFHYLRA